MVSIGSWGVKPVITADQVKAARALLGLSQNKLAQIAGLGVATVKRVEIAPELRGAATTMWKIQTALEAAGVEFIPPDETKGPGVRLKHRTTKRTERAPARKKKG
jgi:transcriptional regulator with XRE-family HTH domain